MLKKVFDKKSSDYIGKLRSNNDGTEFTLRADEDSTILVLSGEPIDEPIASYGPFVMNTNEEIKQTIDDFNSGKFGYLD